MVFIRTVALTVLLVCPGWAQVQRPSSAAPQNAAFQAMVKQAKTHIKEIIVPQLSEWLNSDPKLVLIDVREDREWDAGHAAKALHLGRGVLDRDIEAAVPAKDTRIVLYCHSGSRSALAADTLQQMGYSHVFSLAGGFTAYQAARLPVSK